MEEYGPNDGQVLRFLEQVSNLTVAQARRLVEARSRSGDPDGDRAERAVRRAALMADRPQALEAARAAIGAWGRSRGVPWFGRSRRVYGDRHVSVGDAAAQAAAMPALLDTIGALVVRDLLEPAELEVLMGPWLAATSGAEPDPEGAA